jgi:hypothetical protein
MVTRPRLARQSLRRRGSASARATIRSCEPAPTRPLPDQSCLIKLDVRMRAAQLHPFVSNLMFGSAAPNIRFSEASALGSRISTSLTNASGYLIHVPTSCGARPHGPSRRQRFWTDNRLRARGEFESRLAPVPMKSLPRSPSPMRTDQRGLFLGNDAEGFAAPRPWRVTIKMGSRLRSGGG